MARPQDIVSENVADRGYREGWTAEQFAARQLAKMQEEVGELAPEIIHPDSNDWLLDMCADIAVAGRIAKGAFDECTEWVVPDVAVDRAKEELMDVMVTVLCLASALEELSGEKFDVIESAVEKSGADISRGIRAQT